MKKNYIYAGILIALATVCALAQTPTPTPIPTPLPPPSLDTILSEANKQRQMYQEEFKNLLADEKKTFETYDKSGAVKKKNIVESTLLVYQSPKAQDVSTELRNILKVDDKLVPDSQKRSEQLLAELQKTSTVEKELEKIQSEGSRYDKTLEINGLTVYEAAVLTDNLRHSFDFKLEGTENHQGNDVYVISYQQTKKSPYVSLNEKGSKGVMASYNFSLDVPGALKNSDALLRGKLWIDAKTFQIWREERELTVQDQSPVVLLGTSLDYQASQYGILVPKQISLTTNKINKNSNQYSATKDTQVTFDYTNFRKTDVDIKIIDEP